MKLYSIAIDGPSGAGKSTLARALAAKLGFVYVDTGAIYRTVGYAVRQRGIEAKDEAAVAALLPSLSVTMTFGADGLQRMYLNGADVTEEIRLPEISLYASAVSALPAVRAFLLEMQRDMARIHSVIMDGRDIGTVVLPEAGLKIFLTAEAEERARRREKELRERGTPQPYETILAEMQRRDYNDSHRAEAPLRKAADAVEVDTTHLSFEESLGALLSLAGERLGVAPCG